MRRFLFITMLLMPCGAKASLEFHPSSYIFKEKHENPNDAAINLMFKFRNLAEHFDRKSYAYRKFSHMLIRKSKAGKNLIDEDIRKIIDDAARDIYGKHFKNKRIEYMTANFLI